MSVNKNYKTSKLIEKLQDYFKNAKAIPSHYTNTSRFPHLGILLPEYFGENFFDSSVLISLADYRKHFSEDAAAQIVLGNLAIREPFGIWDVNLLYQKSISLSQVRALGRNGDSALRQSIIDYYKTYLGIELDSELNFNYGPVVSEPSEADNKSQDVLVPPRTETKCRGIDKIKELSELFVSMESELAEKERGIEALLKKLNQQTKDKSMYEIEVMKLRQDVVDLVEETDKQRLRIEELQAEKDEMHKRTFYLNEKVSQLESELEGYKTALDDKPETLIDDKVYKTRREWGDELFVDEHSIPQIEELIKRAPVIVIGGVEYYSGDSLLLNALEFGYEDICVNIKAAMIRYSSSDSE